MPRTTDMANAQLIDDVAVNRAEFPEPRAFQIETREKLRQGVRDKHRAQMVMAPTGAGKTYVGLYLCSEALARARRAVFLCDRTTLINQTSDVADRYGLRAHGVYQAQHWRTNAEHPLQIASVQTIAARGARWPQADVLIVDEAHTQMKVVTDYIQSWKDADPAEGPKIIGLSATPFSRGLGKLYSNLVNATTMHELTESGVLVPMRPFSCTPINMKGAEKNSTGEWSEKAATERGLQILGDVVTEWKRYAADRKTICFGSSIVHCEAIARQFNEAGVMAAVFCSTTTDDQRKALLAEYRKADSKLRVLVSVEALAKGFDVPDVGCVIDCRPLRKSLSTAIQMWGRGLRSSPGTGKADCILLDHSGNIVRFASDYSTIFFDGLDELDAGEVLDKKAREDNDDGEDHGKECPACGYKPFSVRCVACGFKPQSTAMVQHGQGVMQPVMIGRVQAATNQRHLWDQLTSYTRCHGNQQTARQRAYYLFKHIANIEPPRTWGVSAEFVEITRPVMGKIRESQMAYREAMKTKEARAQSGIFE